VVDEQGTHDLSEPFQEKWTTKSHSVFAVLEGYSGIILFGSPDRAT
jgi:hypothetical protein